MAVELLPDARCRRTVGSVPSARGTMVPIQCVNCGAFGGHVLEKYLLNCFHLCNRCAATWGRIAYLQVESDRAFWQRVEDAERNENAGQLLDAHGRLLALSDPNSYASKFEREWLQAMRRAEG